MAVVAKPSDNLWVIGTVVVVVLVLVWVFLQGPLFINNITINNLLSGGSTPVPTAAPTPIPSAPPGAPPAPVSGDWLLPTPLPAPPGGTPIPLCNEGEIRRDVCIGTTRTYQICRNSAWPTIQEPNSVKCGGTAPVPTAPPAPTEQPTEVPSATPIENATATPTETATPTPAV